MVDRSEYSRGEFCWVDLLARDAKALIPFYSELFGWEAKLQPSGSGPEYYIFEVDGKNVCGLVQMPFMVKLIGIPTQWNSYVSVDDIDNVVNSAVDLGASITLPVTDVTTAGKMAFLKDPEGASFGVWQKLNQIGAEIKSENNTWGWNELVTNQCKQAEKFYGDLFGWTYTGMECSPESPYRLIEQDGVTNGGLLPAGDVGGAGVEVPVWRVYFQVANLRSTLEKLKVLGGSVKQEPYDCGVGTAATVSDPQGGTFCLIEMKGPAV